jgi:spermidine synthase
VARAWETLETLDTAAGPLSLRRRGERDFLIAHGARVLMTSAAHGSEDVLGARACAGLDRHAAPRVLIGGLGMGYTLRAALDALGPGARVVVAEIEPAVVRWCQGWLAPLTRGAAVDPRVELRVADVAAVIGEVAARQQVFHAIALDLFEGPRGDRAEAGHPVYGDRALAATARALAPGGTLAVWSEAEARGFERRLESAGFAVTRVRAGGGRRHVVYLARAGGAPAPRVSRAARPRR